MTREGQTGVASDAASEGSEGRAHFPLGWYVDFLRVLAEQRERIDVLTYADLPWEDDRDHRSRYPAEHMRWKERAPDDRIAVLIQHDVDSFPELTFEMLREEERLGIRSNVMLFNRRIDRRRLERSGEVSYTDYALDTAELQRLGQLGWVIGYHSNAYEQARFDSTRAQAVFAEDVAALRARFEIEFFSPHGGARDAAGRSNTSLEVPPALQSSLRWVHNGYGPIFDREWSDGALSSGTRHPDELDLARFVRSWQPGHRYRVLVHPQYYTRAPRRVASLAGVPWYEQCLRAYAGDDGSATTARSKRAGFADLEVSQNSRVFAVGERVRARVIRRAARGRIERAAPPVFVRGVSRSGGTLTVTLIDAHPQIAMSYELYPNLLGAGSEHAEYASVGHGTADAQGTGLLAGLWARVRHQEPIARLLETKDERTFFARCERGGLSRRRVADDYARHLVQGLGFDNLYGQLRFIERCCQIKMQAEGKRRWGLKCSNQFDAYRELWPDAHFINVIRDGRDVLASQKNTGSFDARPERVGASWAETHRAFDEFVARTGARGYRLIYEQLARDPETELRKLCEFMEVPFEPVMLRFHEQDLTIYKRSTGHLSAKRIAQPIDTTQIGRWKKDLSEDDLAQFYSTAREAMQTYGYFERD